MKSLTIFLIIVLCTLSINASCIKDEQNPEAQTSAFSEFLGDIKCGIKFGAKKTGDAIRNSYGYVKDKLTPKKDADKIDVRSAVGDLNSANDLEVVTVAMTVDDRSLFEAPCKGFTDRNGVCRQSD